jgi:predicted DNA-binding transcriptional regulator YafY
MKCNNCPGYPACTIEFDDTCILKRDGGILVSINYTNYRGERRTYRIRPIRLYYGTDSYHLRKQWLLDAEDVTRGVIRTFAMDNLHKWEPA